MNSQQKYLFSKIHFSHYSFQFSQTEQLRYNQFQQGVSYQETFMVQQEYSQDAKILVKRNRVHVRDWPWFPILRDLDYFDSMIDMFKVDRIIKDFQPKEQRNDESEVIFRASFVLSNQEIYTDQRAGSIEVILGLTGGLTYFLLSFLSWVSGPCRRFSSQNKLIGALYGSSRIHPGAVIPITREEAEKAARETINSSRRYSYSYGEFVAARLLQCICCSRRSACCKKRLEKLERHKQASIRLTQELDLINLIQNQRVFGFLADIYLNSYQRILVQKFRKYQLEPHESDKQLHQQQKELDQRAIQELIGKLNIFDLSDAALLQELTGYNHEKNSKAEIQASKEEVVYQNNIEISLHQSEVAESIHEQLGEVQVIQEMQIQSSSSFLESLQVMSLSDETMVRDKAWRTLKQAAMLAGFDQTEWYRGLTEWEQGLVNDLIRAQRAQGNLDRLNEFEGDSQHGIAVQESQFSQQHLVVEKVGMSRESF